MRKASFFILSLASFVLLGTKSTDIKATAEAKSVYIGGMPAGFTLSVGGAQIIGITEVITEEGAISPSMKAGLKPGDIIVQAEGINVRSMSDFNAILDENKDKSMKIRVKREDKELDFSISPVRDKKSGKFKIGVLIRDCMSGIGTITYVDKETHRFGALGHAVTGEDKKSVDIVGGEVFPCSIVGVLKGVRGKAGELRGMFMGEPLAKADKICEYGIYGTLSSDYDYSALQTGYVGDIDRVKIGKGYIYSTINGDCPKKYTIEIVKVDKNNKNNKNYVIKITDKDLMQETGGIVQGMSGSPIIQNDRIIGAVTHVFLNDPTRGYGIDISSMMGE